MGDINLKAALGGQIVLTPTNTASNYTATFPAVTGVVSVQASASYTTGSVLFVNSSGQIAQDNANFFWDDTNNRLGIGTATPTAALSVFSASISPTSVGNGVRFLESTNGYGINLGGSSTGYAWIQGIYGGSSTLGYNDISIQPNGGNVGIGTTTPSTYGLEVKKASGAAGILVSSGANNGGWFIAGTDAYITNNSNGPLQFWTNGAERMRIDSSGNFALGTNATTNQRFTIASNGSSSSANAFYVYNSTPTALFIIRNDGAMYCGTAPASPYNLTTGSAANMFVDSGGVIYRSTSSLKYKTDVQNATHGLSDVLNLRPVTYKGKNDGDTIFGGLIAEEVDEAGLTEFVVYDGEGNPDALHYGNMVSLAFKAIQELSAKNDALEARIAALEAK
jgi:hypothetical protein